VLYQSAILAAGLDFGSQTDLRPRTETVQWRPKYVNGNQTAYCWYTQCPRQTVIAAEVNACKAEAWDYDDCLWGIGVSVMPTASIVERKTRGGNGATRVSYTSAYQTVDKLSERVYQGLKRDIITGILRPGEAVTEKDLASRYKSSRTPVREAALRLEEQNLLQNVPNRGYFVTHLTVKDLNDIYEYRSSVECTCAELAASRGIPSNNLPELNKLASRRSRPDSRASFEEFIAADTSFHINIARLTRNSLLVRAVSEMRCQMERILFAGIDALDTSYYYGDLPVHGHQGILRAIKEGNGKLARKLMHEHIMSAKEEVIQLVQNGSRLI